MTFLPIVQRELRLLARKRATSRVRWWTALLAIVVSGFAMMLLSVGGRRNPGKPLFDFLTFYAFALCLLAGVVLTADALAEEKRAGTLGLLFLTDLKGYDVVLGKFAASWLTAFYALLALLPIAALPVLLGGVTGAEFWRMALALVNALFLSLTAGVLISAFMREASRAMGNTLGLLLLLSVLLPLLGAFLARTGLASKWLGLTWLSPFAPFAYSSAVPYRAWPSRYWLALAGSHLLGWAFLTVASWSLPRLWQDTVRPVKGKLRMSGWLSKRRNPARRAKARARLLPKNPILWLVYDELGVPGGAWAVVLGWGVLVLLSLFLFSDEADLWYSRGYAFAVMPFGFLFKVFFALQACRFFIAARRDGALELLLCTPLSDREIVRGQAFALWRAFLWPLTTFILLIFLPVLVRLAVALLQTQFNFVLEALSGSVFGGLFCARLVLDLFAVCWFGMALALTLKRPQLAPGLTILYVLVLPSLVSMCYLDVLADVFFISWGLSKVQQDLRRLVSRQFLTAPSAPPASPLPPVIPAHR